jgi:hypothetical protein
MPTTIILFAAFSAIADHLGHIAKMELTIIFGRSISGRRFEHYRPSGFKDIKFW